MNLANTSRKIDAETTCCRRQSAALFSTVCDTFLMDCAGKSVKDYTTLASMRKEAELAEMEWAEMVWRPFQQAVFVTASNPTTFVEYREVTLMRRDAGTLLDELEDMELRLSEALEVNRRLQSKLCGELQGAGRARPLLSKEEQDKQWDKIAKVLNAA